jgi:hypothetical protein
MGIVTGKIDNNILLENLEISKGLADPFVLKEHSPSH